MAKQNKGFTLVEVLIAGVILFATISMITLIYKNSLLVSEKSSNNVELTTNLPLILVEIRNIIRSKGNENRLIINESNVLNNLSFNWQAKLIDHKSSPTKFDADSGDFITEPLRYKLWKVTLTIEINKMVREYTFNEVSWSDA